jgi:hypothetical protein
MILAKCFKASDSAIFVSPFSSLTTNHSFFLFPVIPGITSANHFSDLQLQSLQIIQMLSREF